METAVQEKDVGQPFQMRDPRQYHQSQIYKRDEVTTLFRLQYQIMDDELRNPCRIMDLLETYHCCQLEVTPLSRYVVESTVPNFSYLIYGS